MANEITVSSTLSFAKGLLSAIMSIKDSQFLMTGTKYIRSSMAVPTTAGGTAIPKGSIGTPGWFFIRNNDQVNFVTILSAAAGTVLLKLKPNEFAMGRFSVAAPAALSDTAICEIDYLIIED